MGNFISCLWAVVFSVYKQLYFLVVGSCISCMRGCRLYLEPVVVDVEGGVVGLGSSVSKTGGADFTVFVFLSQDLFVFQDLTLFYWQWSFRTQSAHFVRRTMVTLFLSALGSTSPWDGEDSKLPSEWKLPLMRPANVSAWKSINILIQYSVTVPFYRDVFKRNPSWKRSYHICILIVDGEQLVEQISHLGI